MTAVRTIMATIFASSCVVLAVSSARLGARPEVETLQATAALPSHFNVTFTEPIAYAEAASGESLVLDRRGHAVFVVNAPRTTVRKLVDFGLTSGGVVQPGAMAMGPPNQFAIADAPSGVDRIQYLGVDGRRLGGFYLPDKAPRGDNMPAHLIIGPLVMSGVGSMQFGADTFLISLPGRGALMSEVDFHGITRRQFGEPRPTGQEQDPELHVALNAGIPLIDPTGGFYYVFQTGRPMFRKYDEAGTLLFERHIEGVELDKRIRDLPAVWPARTPGDGRMPYAEPQIRAATVDPSGQLLISLVAPFTYVYDEHGDKVRTIQFDAAGIVAPTSLFFASKDRLLITPRCAEFNPRKKGA